MMLQQPKVWKSKWEISLSVFFSAAVSDQTQYYESVRLLPELIKRGTSINAEHVSEPANQLCFFFCTKARDLLHSYFLIFSLKNCLQKQHHSFNVCLTILNGEVSLCVLTVATIQRWLPKDVYKKCILHMNSAL